MGVFESRQYDGEGHVVGTVDVRGIERQTTFDAVGRPIQDVLIERETNAGQPLVLLARSYLDTPDADGLTRATDTDALGNQTSHRIDALGREVQTIDALGFVADQYFDAKVRRGTRDRRNYVTHSDYDGADRLLAQTEFIPTSAMRTADGTQTYQQTTSYDDGLVNGLL